MTILKVKIHLKWDPRICDESKLLVLDLRLLELDCMILEKQFSLCVVKELVCF